MSNENEQRMVNETECVQDAAGIQSASQMDGSQGTGTDTNEIATLADGAALDADNLGFVTYLEEHLGLQKLDLRTFSPLTLAYIGDCIYEIVIRTILVHDGNAPVNKLHKRASNLVKASAQKEILNKIRDDLTEEELSVFKRGRNAKSFTSAKNATMGEYRTATGFEALMGYLYLDNRMNRLIELVKKGLEKE